MEDQLTIAIDRTKYDSNAKILERFVRKNPKTKSILFYRIGNEVEVIKDDAAHIPDYLMMLKEKGVTAIIPFFNFLAYEEQDLIVANDYYRNKIFSVCKELGITVEDYFWATIKTALPLVLGLREIDYIFGKKGLGFVQSYQSPFDD